MATANVKISRMPKNVELHVTVYVTRQFRMRVWLGTQLLKLAVRVIGFSVRVNTEIGEKEDDQGL